MKNRFWLKLTLFVFPFALIFLLVTGTLVYCGESMPLAMVVALQQGDESVLYRPRYGNRDFPYKLLSVEARRPAVLAAGSSRVLQMRSQFLNLNPAAFYNAGAPAWSLTRVHQFLQALDENALPRVLILGLDQPWFNPNFVPEAFPPEVSDFEQLFLVNRSVFQDTLAGIRPLDIAQLFARIEPGYGGLALGIRAITDGHGFRSDGSEQYGDFLIGHFLSPETERNRHLEWMHSGEEMYVMGDTVSEDALRELESLLQFCEAHGIYVIGFFPPFTPTLYAEMTTNAHHTYIEGARTSIIRLFADYQFTFFDFSDGAQFGGDGDFFDGWHASERIYLQMYIRMVEALPQLLGQYSDLTVLYEAVLNATDTFNVFGG